MSRKLVRVISGVRNSRSSQVLILKNCNMWESSPIAAQVIHIFVVKVCGLSKLSSNFNTPTTSPTSAPLPPSPLSPLLPLPAGLSHLCEFIEDCEHVDLASRILYLLGREGPKCQTPSKFIRFIYNRVLLEAPAVRAGESSVYCTVRANSVCKMISRTSFFSWSDASLEFIHVMIILANIHV